MMQRKLSLGGIFLLFFLLFAILSCIQPDTTSTADTISPVIDWKDADKYFNQYVIVEGTILDTYNSGNVCFLNFDTDYQYYLGMMCQTMKAVS